MDGFDALVKAIADVNSELQLAAFTIAGLVLLATIITRSRSSKTDGNGVKRSNIPTSVAVVLIIAFFTLGALPTLANTWLKHEQIKTFSVYNVRTLVLNPEGNPVSGASLRTTAQSVALTGPDGTAEVEVYKATMPADGKVTIFADMESEFLHGHSEIQLDKDPNPSLTIKLAAQGNATVSGLVEDERRHAVPDASVSVLGGESGRTQADGMFSLKTNASVGQEVRIHVEKAGYDAVDQEHPAGREPVTIMLGHASANKGSRGHHAKS